MPLSAQSDGSVEANLHKDRSGDTVLVVDGTLSTRRMMARQLSSLGYVTLEAEKGLCALKMLQSDQAIDVLVTGVTMPDGMSGFKLADQARRLRPDLKIIYVSGLPGAAQERDKLDPTSILLEKPFRMAELRDRVREVLDVENVSSA